jgi:hypothetical protein
MRRPPAGMFVPVEPIGKLSSILMWHTCAFCGVRFRSEPGFRVCSRLALSRPDEEVRACGGNVMVYCSPTWQSLCNQCGKKLLATTPYEITPRTLVDNFRQMLQESHPSPDYNVVRPKGLSRIAPTLREAYPVEA